MKISRWIFVGSFLLSFVTISIGGTPAPICPDCGRPPHVCPPDVPPDTTTCGIPPQAQQPLPTPTPTPTPAN